MIQRRLHAGARAVLLAGALLVLMPALALAHLGLSRSTPAEGAHLAEAPRELRLTFTEAVELAVARLRLIGPSGAEVPVSQLRHGGDSLQVIVADVAGPLEGGVYRLEWQVIGRDGHPVRGTVAYVIAPGAAGLTDPAGKAPAGTAPDDSTMPPDHAATHHDPTSMPDGESFGAASPGFVIVRALQFIALLTVLGALAFALVVLRLLRRTEPDDALVGRMRDRAAGVAFWAAGLMLITAVLRLYAQSLAMHGPGEALDVRFMVAMVVNTGWGWGWIIQVLAAVVAVTGFAMARRGRASGWVVAGAGGLLLALTPALSGHAAATSNLAPLAVAADALHVIGAAGWLGSLLFVLVVGIPTAMRSQRDRGASVARLIGAFSPTALAFAGIVVLTGTFAAWLHIGVSPALWRSDYGRTLLVKLAFLSVVFLTGAYNWRRVKPALGDDAAARRMQRSATVELAVGVMVLIVTAVLVATPPPPEGASSGEVTAVEASAAPW